MYQTDSILRIGNSHKICEDYVINNENGTFYDKPICIISDGCSSSIHTDVGARLLSWLAFKIFRENYKYNIDCNELNYLNVGSKIYNNALKICTDLHIPYYCLDATLMILWIDENDNCQDMYHIFMYGDGCIFTIDNENIIKSYSYDFSYNAPYYLSARFLDSKEFEEQFSNSKCIEKIDDNISREFDYKNPILFSFPVKDYKSVLISSDGIFSFMDNNLNMKVVNSCVTKQISNIKNYNGEFIKRRISRMISDLAKENIGHYDDISITGISRI